MKVHWANCYGAEKRLQISQRSGFSKIYEICSSQLVSKGALIVTLHGISGNKVNIHTRHARTLKQKN